MCTHMHLYPTLGDEKIGTALLYSVFAFRVLECLLRSFRVLAALASCFNVSRMPPARPTTIHGDSDEGRSIEGAIRRREDRQRGARLFYSTPFLASTTCLACACRFFRRTLNACRNSLTGDAPIVGPVGVSSPAEQQSTAAAGLRKRSAILLKRALTSLSHPREHKQVHAIMRK